MASNRIPVSYDPVVQHLEDAADGARDHGVEAKLKQNLEAAIRLDLVALVGSPAGPGGVPPAVPGKKAVWNAAKADKSAKGAAFRSAVSSGKAVLAACVGVLKPRLGTQWTSAWNAVGFTEGSLEIPANPQTLLLQVRAYFTANPTHEVPNLSATISATAAACFAASSAIIAASTASNNSNTAAGVAQGALQAGIAVGRARLSGLRTELDQTLSDNDPLWYAFGFERPSDPETAEVPVHVVLTPGAVGSHTLFTNWDDARRADSYRVRVLSTATPPVELAARIVTESEAMFTSLAPGAVKVVVTAINEAGESLPSVAVAGTVV